MKRITVLLADDHTVVREGLRALLELESDIEVVDEASTGRKAIELAKQLRPEVLVMDLAMPLLNGLEATRQILKAIPDTKVLILSAHGEDEYVEEAINAGAAGYLMKHASADILSKAIREVRKGNTFCSPTISRRLQDRREKVPSRRGTLKKKNTHLSSREVEVLQLIAEGMANKQVAAELGISIKTVEKHRQNIMDKLNIHDTAGLTRYAISARIINNPANLTVEPED